MNEQLAEIRTRRAAITPGVWTAYRRHMVGFPADEYVHVECGGELIADCGESTVEQAHADAAFIAAAPGDIDTLLAMVERLQQLQSGARKDIEYLQHDGATWKGLFEDMRQKCDTARAERDALAAQLAQAQRELAAQNPDWTKAPNLAKWWAVDEDGTAHWYWTEPTMGKHGWFVRGNSAYCNVTSQSAGHVELIGSDWWDTLRQRQQN